MYAHHHHHVEHELLKWLVLIVIALALVLFATQPADGQLAKTEVATATESTAIAQPLLLQQSPNTNTSNNKAPRNDLPTARRIWEVFELHADRELEAAIDSWQELSLFTCDEPWRAVAVGTAYLQLGDLDNALCVLNESTEKANAVTHHLRGVVHWMNSRVATRDGKLYLAEQYRDFARTEFEKAIALASQVRLEEKLGLAFTKFVSTRQVDPLDTIFPESLLPPKTPSVRDLLETLRLDDFVTKSHVGLAELGLEEGLLDEVEDHLDDAAEMGSDVNDLYVVLGEAYEADGQPMSATRVFMKAMTGQKESGSAIKASRNLRKANPLD